MKEVTAKDYKYCESTSCIYSTKMKQRLFSCNLYLAKGHPDTKS